MMSLSSPGTPTMTGARSHIWGSAGSHRYLGTVVTDTGMPVDPETRLYTYDSIGNRKTSEEHTLLRTYNANSLNKYDQIITGTQPETPEYDEDGNMTAYNDRKNTYNAENRLIVSEPEIRDSFLIHLF